MLHPCVSAKVAEHGSAELFNLPQTVFTAHCGVVSVPIGIHKVPDGKKDVVRLQVGQVETTVSTVFIITPETFIGREVLAWIALCRFFPPVFNLKMTKFIDRPGG